MTEPFTLTATPGLLSEGEGHLEFVTFVADNGKETKKWSAVNNSPIYPALPETGSIRRK